MPEVIDEEEAKQEQEEANASRRSPAEAPVEHPELTSTAIDEALAQTTMPEDPAGAGSPVVEDDDDREAEKARQFSLWRLSF